jgi:hypothetical protein
MMMGFLSWLVDKTAQVATRQQHFRTEFGIVTVADRSKKVDLVRLWQRRRAARSAICEPSLP